MLENKIIIIYIYDIILYCMHTYLEHKRFKHIVHKYQIASIVVGK
jgi:hypothetical protein